MVVREGLETVAVAVSHPSEDSRVASRLHARLPLHVGAGQRLLLSRAPADVVTAVFARPLVRRGPDTITDPEAMRAEFARIRQQDWALSEQQLDLNYRGIAVPVRNTRGLLMGALNVTMPIGQESSETAVARVLNVLRDVAQAMRPLV